MTAGSVKSEKFALRLLFARLMLKNYPLSRGRNLLTKILLFRFHKWPDQGSFDFRFGRFEDVPLGPWPLGYRELFLYGVMEQAEVSVWKRILRPGDVVIDAGANLGYWSLVASRMVGRNGRVYAFEPVMSTFEKLKQNLKASDALNVICYQLALADKCGDAYIAIAKDDPIKGWSTLGKRADVVLAEDERFLCSLVRLDDVFSDSSLRLLKLDIEGAELLALRGAQRTIKRLKPIISFEWNREATKGFGYEPEEILYFLSTFGYSFWLASRKGEFVPFSDLSRDRQWTPMIWALSKEHY